MVLYNFYIVKSMLYTLISLHNNYQICNYIDYNLRLYSSLYNKTNSSIHYSHHKFYNYYYILNTSNFIYYFLHKNFRLYKDILNFHSILMIFQYRMTSISYLKALGKINKIYDMVDKKYHYYH